MAIDDTSGEHPTPITRYGAETSIPPSAPDRHFEVRVVDRVAITERGADGVSGETGRFVAWLFGFLGSTFCQSASPTLIIVRLVPSAAAMGMGTGPGSGWFRS